MDNAVYGIGCFDEVEAQKGGQPIQKNVVNLSKPSQAALSQCGYDLLDQDGKEDEAHQKDWENPLMDVGIRKVEVFGVAIGKGQL